MITWSYIADLNGLDCQLCWKQFASKTTLDRHMRDLHTDNGGMKFTCQFCDKQFKNINTLRNHKSLYHKGQK